MTNTLSRKRSGDNIRKNNGERGVWNLDGSDTIAALICTPTTARTFLPIFFVSPMLGDTFVTEPLPFVPSCGADTC